MKIRSIFLLFVLFSAFVPVSIADDAKPFVIFEIKVINNLNNPIGEGGFEMKMDGETYLQPKLTNQCKKVRDVVLEWAMENNLTIIKSYIEKERTLLHLSSPNQKGYFEVLYRYKKLKDQDAVSKLGFIFYDLSGNKMFPEHIDALDTNKIKKKLVEIMTCSEVL